MNTTGLFQVKKRIEPALVKPYLVDVRIFKDPETFYTRFYGLFQSPLASRAKVTA